MRHGATILWAVLATVAGTGLFLLKYQVQAEEQRLRHLKKEIVQTQEEIHVLKAEWSYLNEPSRLRELAERNLGMHPMKATQLASIDSFGMADKRPDEPAQPPSNQFAEDQQQAAPVSASPDQSPEPQLPAQAPQMARPAPAPMPVMPVMPQAPVRSFDVKAVVPAAPVAKPVVKAVPAAAKILPKPAAKPALKTAALKPAKPQPGKAPQKPVMLAHNAAPAAKTAPAPKPVTVAKSSYPSLYPTYASYPAASAPVATPASVQSSGNVMVITSPALGGR